MSAPLQHERPPLERWQVRVRGTVQGVGFRPTVWRLATRFGLRGDVLNDGDGVRIRLEADRAAADNFLAALTDEAPPLSRIDSMVLDPLPAGATLDRDGFRIVPSRATGARTPVTADAACCEACLAEALDPSERRHRYPFTNCTHCGPRFSIVRGIPYDRANTTMAPFALCDSCRAEYEDPADRRFHAQPVACHACGPRARLVRTDGGAVCFDRHSMLDDVDAVAELLDRGAIVAIRGLGGFHLACDATRPDTVARLRERKVRDAKPFALMAPDLATIRRHCEVDEAEAEALTGPEAPIVLLQRKPGSALPPSIAPGLSTLGFFLPMTPLHHLILRRLGRPAVMTSGNLSDEPQITANEDVATRLGAIADFALLHDRDVANRIDDSVVRVMDGRARLLRRARGFAPRPIPLPHGFASADGLVAYGGELKATFCLVADGRAILSPHQGDLEHAATYDAYVDQLDLLGRLFEHRPSARVADLHPDYLSSKLARRRSAADGLPLIEVQHHHAHVASCMAENGVPLDAPPLLGIALDGLGYGDDGTLWGGEFLLADYRTCRRLGTFKPVPMPGGAQAVREPWRNTYAHLMAELGWPRFATAFGGLELFRFLEARPRAVLDRMLERGVNCPIATSCGRLFDAVAAAVGICRERAFHEGQGAMELEAAVDPAVPDRPLAPDGSDLLYPFAISRLGGDGLPYVEPLAMWQALLGDMVRETPVATIAARFHRGLARAIARMAARLLRDAVADGGAQNVAALSGGCFQNRILFELTARELEARGIRVLSHAVVPANDGGLALGQAAIAAAASIQRTAEPRREPCA